MEQAVNATRAAAEGSQDEDSVGNALASGNTLKAVTRGQPGPLL